MDTIKVLLRRARRAKAMRAVDADRVRATERLFLSHRERRLTHDLAAIRARLDLADHARRRP